MSEVRDAILEHFKHGGTLTKIAAISPPFSTTNLGDKVFLLRKQGHDIQKRWETSPTGARYAVYFLAKKEAKAA